MTSPAILQAGTLKICAPSISAPVFVAAGAVFVSALVGHRYWEKAST